MRCSSPRSGTWIVLVVAGLSLAGAPLLSPAEAGWSSANDAGSGHDAGADAAHALALANVGTFRANLTPGDADWYSLAPPTGPVCADLQSTDTMATTLGLAIVSGGTTRTVTTQHDAGATGRLSLAYPSATSVLVSETGSSTNYSSYPWGFGTYRFTLDVQGVPPASAGDANSGADASDASAPLAVAAGCIGGHLSGLTDTLDAYAITLPAGHALTVNLAGSDTLLRLVDPNGSPVGPVLSAGQILTTDVLSPGSYTLTASRSSVNVADAGYVMGIADGPSDPGNPCRPYCLST